jgi:hypothetical protein
LAVDEDWEEEEWDDEWESAKREDPLEDCQEQLDILADTINDFVAELRKTVMRLNANGLLSGEGYTSIMNLIKDYWEEESEMEDQE